MTTAKYYTPSERVIHDVGIEPDVVVPMSVENWRNILISRNRSEETNGMESAVSKDDGWVGTDGDDLPVPAVPNQVVEDAVDLNNVADPQLDRACDMLRGILVFQKR